MLKRLLGLLILLNLTACHTLVVQKEVYKSTKNTLELGDIGNTKGNPLTQDFISKAIPFYKEGVRLNVEFIPFTKQTYKAYRKASESHENKTAFTYTDSLRPQRTYVRLQLADEEKLIQQLQQPKNKSVLQWLQQNKKAKLLTGLSLYLSTSQVEQLQKAEIIVLATEHYKNNVIQLYTKGKQIHSISFAETTTFAYSLSGFCWGKDHRNQWVLAGLSKNASCPNGQYKSYIKATKPKDLLDY